MFCKPWGLVHELIMPVHGGSAASMTHKAGSAVCRSCDSLELQRRGLASCLEPGWQPPAKASPCQSASTLAGQDQQCWERLRAPLWKGHGTGVRDLSGHMAICEVGTQVSGLAKQAASALEQNLSVLGEAQPPKEDMITLLRRSDFPSGIGKSYKHLHKPERNPHCGWPHWQYAKLRCW